MAPETPPKDFVLPESLISSVDMSRVTRELANLDESLYQANARAPGQPVKLARSSQILEDVAAANGASLLDTSQRALLLATLKSFATNAPHIHMSLAAEPTARFTNRTIIWLRQNIHPLILLDIGLQPTLAVGCSLRTNNKIFDMSLRHRFKEQRHILREKINELAGQSGAAAP